ncbi:MAG: Fe-S cluster assembly protein HesB [Solirubrobacterales bacterium]
MLALTPTAAEVVDTIVSQEELPETAGLRITSEEAQAAENSDGSQRDLRLAVVEEPQSGDELVDGTQVYLEPGPTAELLEDKVLDAKVDGSEVRFTLLEQAAPDPD